MEISETYRSILVCYTCNKTMTCGPVVRVWVGIWLSAEGILFGSRYSTLGQDLKPTLTRVSVGKTRPLNATWHLNWTINYYQTDITWRNGFSWLCGSWYTPWRLIIKVHLSITIILWDTSLQIVSTSKLVPSVFIRTHYWINHRLKKNIIEVVVTERFHCNTYQAITMAG